MKPCYGYIRVSTVRQGDGASLEAQKDAITGFASQNDLTIIKWFEEQETASKTGRPVFEAMLRDLRKGAADGLVIHKTDRFSRNYTDWAKIEEITKQGVKFYVAAESYDFESVSGALHGRHQHGPRCPLQPQSQRRGEEGYLRADQPRHLPVPRSYRLPRQRRR